VIRLSLQKRSGLRRVESERHDNPKEATGSRHQSRASLNMLRSTKCAAAAGEAPIS